MLSGFLLPLRTLRWRSSPRVRYHFGGKPTTWGRRGCQDQTPGPNALKSWASSGVGVLESKVKCYNAATGMLSTSAAEWLALVHNIGW